MPTQFSSLLYKAGADSVSLASGTVTATLTGSTPVVLPRPANALGLALTITAAASGGGDTADFYVQTTLDGSGSFFDVCRFAQIVGNGGTKTYYDKLLAIAAQAEFSGSATIAASTVRHMLGDQWRVRCDVGGNPTITYAVTALPM